MKTVHVGVGFVVRKKWRFRKMTIQRVPIDSAIENIECVWFDRYNRLHRQWFPASSLINIVGSNA